MTFAREATWPASANGLRRGGRAKRYRLSASDHRTRHQSRASGNHPFAALLVGPDGEVLLSSLNTYTVDRLGHAEANVARAAALKYDAGFLAGCTMVTSVEPCCMCAGSAYSAGVGAVVYGLSGRGLGDSSATSGGASPST